MHSDLPVTDQGSFRHEALFYEGPSGFLDGTVPFIREGLETGDAIMVAVNAEKGSMLRSELGPAADAVTFVDMAELGRNPGRIIAAWQDFLAENRSPEGRCRGIGEPIWAGRRPAELIECQLHESLLNLAFADEDGFWLLCPYEVGALEPGVVHEAQCSHPYVVEAADRRASRHYRGEEELVAPFSTPLARPATPTETLSFERDTLGDVRRVVARRAGAAGLDAQRVDDLVLAASEVATNSVLHGGGHGVLRVWDDEDALVCEVRDRGHISDPLAGRRRPAPARSGGWGLWLAHRVCDLVQVRSKPGATVVRLFMHAS